jgi:phenylalanyl-tRNA synthetase beta chain
MRVPISWLREYVDLPRDTDEIAHRLAMLGFPVEDVIKRPKITGVIVGRIVDLQKHPNADRLQIGSVDVGNEHPLTIATAATNVAVGQIIPVATIGARLPQLTIEPRKMRGVASQGMMVSADELALPPEWFESGILQLEPTARTGGDVIAEYGLDDDVLEVEVTSNRVDAMSVIGLARELAASYRVPLRLPPAQNPGTLEEPAGRTVDVAIESPDCRRFVAQRFEGVTVGPAPTWMRVKLALAGQRPINNLVDVSNYVMLETGQPLHFYDASAVSGGRLIVRDGRTGEKAVTLDDVERELSPQSLVIADRTQTLCLAGLMGAAAGEVTQNTTAIVLEAANFNGARVRRMSKALGLRSEASSRHEKSLPPALTDTGAARAAQLLVELGATAYRPRAFGEPLELQPPLEVRLTDVKRLLGLELDAGRVTEHLRALGFDVARSDGTIGVTPPAWRADVTIAADVIEEIARMEGYENIPSLVPSVPAHDISSAQFLLENRIAHELDALGYYEIVTYSLVGRRDARSVEVLDPLSEDQRYLRTSILPQMLEYFARNDAPVRVFEIGHVFHDENGHIVESSVATFGFTVEPANEAPWRDSNFLRLKGDCEALLRRLAGRHAETLRDTREGLHPGKTAILIIEGSEVAHLGRIDPRVTAAAGVRLPAYACTLLLERLPDYHIPQYVAPPKFPSTYRDLALEVDLEEAAADIEKTVMQTLGTMCTAVRVFDEYRGPQVQSGHKSIAVRITLQRFDATITDEEADAAIGRVLAAMSERGAVIRQ